MYEQLRASWFAAVAVMSMAACTVEDVPSEQVGTSTRRAASSTQQDAERLALQGPADVGNYEAIKEGEVINASDLYVPEEALIPYITCHCRGNATLSIQDLRSRDDLFSARDLAIPLDTCISETFNAGDFHYAKQKFSGELSFLENRVLGVLDAKGTDVQVKVDFAVAVIVDECGGTGGDDPGVPSPPPGDRPDEGCDKAFCIPDQKPDAPSDGGGTPTKPVERTPVEISCQDLFGASYSVDCGDKCCLLTIDMRLQCNQYPQYACKSKGGSSMSL